MAISPKDNAAQAAEIRRIYEEAELELLRIIARSLVSDPDAPDWQMQKLALVSDLLRKSRAVTGKLNQKIPKELQKLIELAYITGNESAAGDLRAILEQFENEPERMPQQVQMALFPEGFPENKIDIDATMATFAGVNTEAVAAIAAATTGQVTGLHVPIVRATEDIFRQVVTETAGLPLTGALTRLEASQRILDSFASKGIKVFQAGRNTYDIASYAEMATRTAIGQASLTGHIDQMNGYGFDLLQISDHAGECDLCRPWEGKVLSTSGSDPNYKTLREAVAAGLFHANCGHRGNTYIEGLTKPLTNTEDPEGAKERDWQRYLERGKREWLRREAVAMTPEAKEKAAAKVSEWSGRIEEFTQETGRRRKREREQIKRAR